MIVEMLVTGMFQENCYVLGCEETKEALVVDPGDDAEDILAALDRLGLSAKLIVVTHEHIDHIGAIEPVRQATQAQLAMHPVAYQRASNRSWSGRVQNFMAQMWTGQRLPPIGEPEICLEEGQEVAVGKLKFQVLFCPGHTPGHICLYGEGAIFTGDVLFHLSIGRFDLPGGDGRLLLRNIQEKVLTLPEETIVYPGHGPSTTVGEEKRLNPFLRYPRVYLGIDPERE